MSKKLNVSEEQYIKLEDEFYTILCPGGVGDWARATSRKRVGKLIKAVKRFVGEKK